MYTYRTKGVCSRAINVEVEGDTIKHVNFVGGCNGNLKAISKLVEGKDIAEVCSIGARVLRRLLIGASPFSRPLPCPRSVLAIRRALRHERALSPWRGTTTRRARGAIEMW